MASGTNDKKTVFGLPYNVGVGLLCVLGAVCLYTFYSNVLAGPGISAAPSETGKSPAASAAAAAPTIPMPGTLPGPAARPPASSRRNEEFNPPLHKKSEERIDPMKVDPSLRLDLLAKVQAVEAAGGTRNLFQMGAPPKPAELPKGPETIVKIIGPARPLPKVDPAPPAPPEAPSVQLKFYGFSTVVRNGKKTAYFMDGEDIEIAAEGEMVKRRYRVIRILATTVQVEDTAGKRTLVLPIVEAPPN